MIRSFPAQAAAMAALVALLLAVPVPGALAVTFLPLSDADLRARADVIVEGVVVSTTVGADAQGRPETITRIRPLDVLKGYVGAALVLHQLGGSLPDGRRALLVGSPRYTVGARVLVFAIARPEGDYQTAEMLLGKFDVARDASRSLFAVPALAGSDAARRSEYELLHRDGAAASTVKSQLGEPRALDAFKRFLRDPAATAFVGNTPASGALTPLRDDGATTAIEKWLSLGGLWRWNNGAAAAWFLDGTAKIAGGGATEAANALAAWDDEPNSQIAYTLTGSTGANPIHMSANSSPCGWNSCISGAGVVGCGGPNGSGQNAWRGDTYNTITSGQVWLRTYCTTNALSPTETQSVLEHELGHTLGLDHSDTGVSSPHDLCAGDESAAIMTAVTSGQTALGSDDSDAVRWLYGDGGNSCSGLVLSPAGMLDIGDARVGSVSASKTITVGNAGAATIALGSIAATGDFVVTDDCGSSIAPGAHCHVNVAFAPSQPGAAQGTLTIHTTSAGDFQVELDGYGEKPMPAAASDVLVPIVAQTGSYAAEVYVRNESGAGIVLDVDFFEADNSAVPGQRPCAAFAVPAGTTKPLSIASDCTLGAGAHFGMLALHDPTGTHAFTAFARTQTPAGVGFTVDGRPFGAFGSAAAFVDGLKRSASAPQYQSNCFVGALGAALDYRVDLTTRDGAAIGVPITGSLAANHVVRFLDVLALAAAPAGDYSGVRAKFSETSPGSAPLVGFCTMQESVTFSADFRIAKANDVAAPSIVVPVVARTASFETEVYVRNASAAPINVNVRLDEADTSSAPGSHACSPLAIPASATRLISLATQCGLDASSHFGMLAIDDAAAPRAHPFTVFSRSQTPAGVGFSVEGYPVGGFGAAPGFVGGLKRSSSGPQYQSNCFVGALDQSVNYRIDLTGGNGVALGAPVTGSLAPHHLLRYLDVFAAAGAPAGDLAEVTATFSETAGNSPFVGFCTVQESVTFGADFRIAD